MVGRDGAPPPPPPLAPPTYTRRRVRNPLSRTEVLAILTELDSTNIDEPFDFTSFFFPFYLLIALVTNDIPGCKRNWSSENEPSCPTARKFDTDNSSSHNHIHGHKSAFLLFSVLPFFFLSYLFLLCFVGFHGTKAGRQGGVGGGGHDEETKKQ